MTSGSVRVLRAHVALRAATGEELVAVRGPATDALQRALAVIGREAGERWYLMPRVHLALRLTRQGGADAPDLVATMVTALRREVSILDSADEGAWTSCGVWFASEARAMAAWLLATRRATAEAHAMAAAGWTADADGLLMTAAASGSLGEMLGALAEWAEEEELSEIAGVVWNAAEVGVEVAGDILSSLPEAFLLELRSMARRLRDGREESIVAVMLAAHVFRRWPPARPAGARLLAETARLLRTHGEPQRGAEPPRGTRARSSRAGGLVVWAARYGDLVEELVRDFAPGRERRAVRWMLARGLEAPTLPTTDPLLLLWSGEAPDAHVDDRALAVIDPERLHAAAIRLADRAGLLGEAVFLAQRLEETYLFTESGLFLDVVQTGGEGDPMSRLVVAFARRSGQAPSKLVEQDLDDGQLDRLREIHAPRLPAAWWPALNAATSLLASLAERDLELSLSEMRIWEASVITADPIEVRLEGPRSRAVRLPSRVRMGDVELAVRPPLHGFELIRNKYAMRRARRAGSRNPQSAANRTCVIGLSLDPLGSGKLGLGYEDSMSGGDDLQRAAVIGIDLVDAMTHEPLISAGEVQADETVGVTSFAVTPSRWAFEGISPGSHEFQLRAPSYVDRTVTATVPSGPGELRTFELLPRTGYPFGSTVTRVVGAVRLAATVDPATPVVTGAEVTLQAIHSVVDTPPESPVVTQTTEDGQYVMWFQPIPGLDPPLADQYSVSASATVGGVPMTGTLSAQALTPNRANAAPDLFIEP